MPGSSQFETGLSEERRLELCNLLATFASNDYIKSYTKKHWGESVNSPMISYYRYSKRYKPLIDRARQEWAAGVMDLPIAHKRTRIEKLTNLFEQSLVDPRRTAYQRRSEAIKILEKVKNEMEEAKTHFSQVFMTYIQNYTYQELVRSRDEIVAKLKMWGGFDAIRRSAGHETPGGLLEAPQRAGEDTVSHDPGPASPAQPQDGLAGDYGQGQVDAPAGESGCGDGHAGDQEASPRDVQQTEGSDSPQPS